jgi:hypothetical protein
LKGQNSNHRKHNSRHLPIQKHIHKQKQTKPQPSAQMAKPKEKAEKNVWLPIRVIVKFN